MNKKAFDGMMAGLEDAIAYSQGDKTRGRVARRGDRPFDAFHHHEVLHTAAIMQSMFEEHVEQHRYVQATPELKIAADRVSAALADFYQTAGQLTPPA